MVLLNAGIIVCIVYRYSASVEAKNMEVAIIEIIH